MMLARSFIPSPVLALASTVACATGCGLDAAYAAFTTTTGEASTGEGPEPSESTSTLGGSSSTADGSDGGSGTTASAMSSTSTASTTSGDDTSEPVCGDGVVEGEEECDGGERCFECTRDRWIFVTADSTHDGKFLDGIDGADSLCRQYSLQGGATDATWKTFIAWISDADHPMRDRLPAGIRGRYVRTDGVVVVDRAEDLFSGTLLAPINVDEHGQTVAGDAVITNTMPDGTAAPGTHCDSWTSESFLNMSMYLGDPAATDGRWTMEDLDNPSPCGSHWRLYCLEGA
jgi:hypothetical protein